MIEWVSLPHLAIHMLLRERDKTFVLDDGAPQLELAVKSRVIISTNKGARQFGGMVVNNPMHNGRLSLLLTTNTEQVSILFRLCPELTGKCDVRIPGIRCTSVGLALISSGRSESILI